MIPLRRALALAVLPSLFLAAPKPPKFFDFDCELVDANGGALANWNAVYAWVEETVVKPAKDKTIKPTYHFPGQLRHLVEGELAPRAEEECPLGVLYLRVLVFYEEVAKGTDNDGLLPFANRVQKLLTSFPVYAIALSRWPVFYALEHFAPAHGEQDEFKCSGQQGVLDWGHLREFSVEWAHKKRNGLGVEDGTLDQMERVIADMFYTILRWPANQQAAQEECEFGFYFLVANQVVAAANRETQHLPPFNIILDAMIERAPFTRLAASGWPILTVLAIFSDLNKGIWFFGGDRKYLRGYSDWNLRSSELAPLAPPSLDFLSPEWKTAAGKQADEFLLLNADAYHSKVETLVDRHENVHGKLRPIVRSLIDAALAIVATDSEQVESDGTRRRLTYVVLLYGSGWARLLMRLEKRLHEQLGVLHPLLVVAIGSDAAQACAKLADKNNGRKKSQQVICWSPGSQSQVHRFTIMNGLLHMGIDVLYVDMDTFMMQDPTPRILAQAEGKDALFARHADADCINIGIFYLRAGRRAAVWMSQFLVWYHDYPFEVDQRGLHVFLQLPAEQIRIGYPPEDLVSVRAGVIEDLNEVVIGDVGWVGTYSRLSIFHWCHRPLAQKEEEINMAYDAADSLDDSGLPLVLAIETAAGAMPGGAWVQVLQLRAIFEAYRKETPPERTPCW